MTGILCVAASAVVGLFCQKCSCPSIVSAGESHLVGRSCKGRRCRQHGPRLQTPLVRQLCLLGSCVMWFNTAAPLHDVDSSCWQLQPGPRLRFTNQCQSLKSISFYAVVAEPFGTPASSGCNPRAAASIGTHLQLVQVVDPVVMAQCAGDELGQRGVAERQPTARGHAVRLVLELLRPEVCKLLQGTEAQGCWRLLSQGWPESRSSLGGNAEKSGCHGRQQRH